MSQNSNFTGQPEEMLNRWVHKKPWYYGLRKTYKIGMDWLNECASVEDWGCGAGWAKRFCRVPYVGIDGSAGPETDRIEDLRHYKSKTPGLFMRHVLEHNLEWETVLDNALESFQQRMALIMFLNWADHTHQVTTYPSGIVLIAFSEADIVERVKPFLAEQFQCSNGKYSETILLLKK